VYCVNAGSNSVSSFIVDNTGTFQLEHVYDSGGELPAILSISPNDQTLYVVNIGALGRLVSIPVRTRTRNVYVTNINGAVNLFLTSPTFPVAYPRLTTPGDSVVSADGRFVLVTDKTASTVSAYRTAGSGRLLPTQKTPPVVWQNTHNFNWPLYWEDNTTLIVGAFGPNPAYVNVLNFNPATGTLTPISEITFDIALCWISKAANYYYLGQLSQFLPGFSVDPVTKVASKVDVAGLGPGHAFEGAIGFFDQHGIDGKLYNLGYLDATPHTVYAFDINPADGSATIINFNNEAPVAQGMTAI